MKTVISVRSAMVGADEAFQSMVELMNSSYSGCVKNNNLPSHDEDGVPLFYEVLWVVCAADALASLKEYLPRQYQLLCEEAGGENAFREKTMAK